jgi:hypothetical protein
MSVLNEAQRVQLFAQFLTILNGDRKKDNKGKTIESVESSGTNWLVKHCQDYMDKCNDAANEEYYLKTAYKMKSLRILKFARLDSSNVKPNPLQAVDFHEVCKKLWSILKEFNTPEGKEWIEGYRSQPVETSKGRVYPSTLLTFDQCLDKVQSIADCWANLQSQSTLHATLWKFGNLRSEILGGDIVAEEETEEEEEETEDLIF